MCPVYLCERKNQDPRIVEAPNPAAARQFVARTEITVTKMGVSEAFAHSNRGARLEVAGEEPIVAEEPRAPSGIGEVGGYQEVEELDPDRLREDKEERERLALEDDGS